MITTIARPLAGTGEAPHERTRAVCVNPEHRILALRREQMRVRDHRFVAPAGRIRAHDYCAAPARAGIEEGFCPLGAEADDHDWREVIEPLVLSQDDVWP